MDPTTWTDWTFVFRSANGTPQIREHQLPNTETAARAISYFVKTYRPDCELLFLLKGRSRNATMIEVTKVTQTIVDYVVKR